MSLETRLPEVAEGVLLLTAGSAIIWTGYRMFTRGWHEASDRTWLLGRPAWIPFYGVVAGVICIASMFWHRGIGSFGVSWLGLQLGLLAAFLRVIAKGRRILVTKEWSRSRRALADAINVIWGGVPDGLRPLSHATNWRWSTVLLASFGASLLAHTVVADVPEAVRRTWIMQNASVIGFATLAWFAVEATLRKSWAGTRSTSLACWAAAIGGIALTFLEYR